MKLTQLTEKQKELLLAYRNESQALAVKFLNDLSDEGAKNAPLIVLGEAAGLVGDMIYTIQDQANNPQNLEANRCKTIDDFVDLLFVFAAESIIATFGEFMAQDAAKNAEMEAARTAVKH